MPSEVDMSENARYLITGANGFIGGWTAETLCLRNAGEVRAGIRSWAGAARLSRFPVAITLCDVLDESQVAAAVRGVDVVIHCVSGSPETIVRGTRNVLAASLRSGVRRLVHLSTAEVYGRTEGAIDESFPLAGTEDAYGAPNIEAERACREFQELGLPVSILRPSIVYGPFSKDWSIRLAERLRTGDWGVFPGIGDGICNLIYVSDLVSAILRAAREEAAVGEAFNVVGPDRLTWNEYFRAFNAALGFPELKVVPERKARLSAGLMRPLRASAKFAKAHFEDPLKRFALRYRTAQKVMKTLETKTKYAAQPAEFALYSRNATYLSTKAGDRLGFHPAFDIATGLRLTAEWLDLHGYLRS